MQQFGQEGKILVEHDYLKLSKHDQDVKKATACVLFLDNLQNYLNIVNDDFVGCGCPRCTDMIGGNYPEDEDNKGPSEPGDPNFWIRSGGRPMLAVPTDRCALYEWFQVMCIKWNCLIPEDGIDHPKFWPRSYNLTTCMGKGQGGKITGNWRYRVKALSFEKQMETLYPLLHDIDHFTSTPQDKQSFADWFTVKGISLRPYA